MAWRMGFWGRTDLPMTMSKARRFTIPSPWSFLYHSLGLSMIRSYLLLSIPTLALRSSIKMRYRPPSFQRISAYTIRDMITLIYEDPLTPRPEFKCFFRAKVVLVRFYLRGLFSNPMSNPSPLPGLETSSNPRRVPSIFLCHVAIQIINIFDR